MRQRVIHKVALLTHKVLSTTSPTYLCELVQTHATPRALRSSHAPLLVVSRIHTCRAFLLLLHEPETLCLLTLDCVKTFSLSNAT